MANITYSGEASALLKKYYTKEKIQEMKNMETVILSKIPVKSGFLKGEGSVFLFNYQGNEQGTRSINEAEALPTPNKQVTAQAMVTPKVSVTNFRTTGLSEEMSEGNEAAFAQTFMYNAEGSMRDLLKYENQCVYRSGHDLLAEVNGSVSADTSIVFDNGIPTHFRAGQKLDIVTGGGTSEATPIVTDVNYSTNTITVDSNVTVTDDSLIYLYGADTNAPADGKALTGLPAITDDGSTYSTYENIARTGVSAVPAWKGESYDASGANLTDDLMRKMVMRGKTLVGKQYSLMVSNAQQARAYIATTLPQVRYKDGDNRNSGIKADVYKWGNCDWYIDPDCHFDAVYFFDEESLFLAETSKGMHWKMTGGDKQLRVPGYDISESVMVHYANLACTNTKGVLKLYGLNTSAFRY